MYLNVNLASNASGGGNDASGAAGSCTTPRTPDILNLLAGAPFDNMPPFGSRPTGSTCGGANMGYASSSMSYFQSSASSAAVGVPGIAASTPGDGPSSPGEHASSSFSSFSSLCSSPATPSTPPSIQNTRTYLIKEGLKLTIQSKRLASGRGSLESDQLHHQSMKDETGHLTTEDEERRRRRRERNKVAATKCRNRKKERTGILMQESDVLEDQNVNLRSEMQRLEAEKRRLMDVLAKHSPNCLKIAGSNVQTPVTYPSDFIQADPSTSQASHYAMPGGLSSSSYGSMYDCRSSSEAAAMAGNVPHHHHTSAYDVNAGPPPDYSGEEYSQVMHRGSYGNTENHPGQQNYR